MPRSDGMEREYKYATKAAKSSLIAVWKGISSEVAANNEINPSGFGLVDVGSVRERLDAISGDTEPDKAPARGGGATEGGATGAKRRGTTKRQGKGKKRKTAPDVVLEHTAAGSNTEKNASVLTDVRMGAGKTGCTCASCRAAGVGLEFLAAKKHSRRGASMCDQIRKEWAAAN